MPALRLAWMPAFRHSAFSAGVVTGFPHYRGKVCVGAPNSPGHLPQQGQSRCQRCASLGCPPSATLRFRGVVTAFARLLPDGSGVWCLFWCHKILSRAIPRACKTRKQYILFSAMACDYRLFICINLARYISALQGCSAVSVTIFFCFCVSHCFCSPLFCFIALYWLAAALLARPFLRR
jgi:hypothetical protein